MSLSQLEKPAAGQNPANTYYVYSLTAQNLVFVTAIVSGNLSVLGGLSVAGSETIGANLSVAGVSSFTGNITSGGGPVNIVAPINQNINLSTSGTGGVQVFGNNFNVNVVNAGLHLTGDLFVSTASVAASTAPIINSASMLQGLPLANGQLVVGSAGAAPVAANITAGTNIAVTNGAGSITISSAAAPTFSSVSFSGSGTLSSYSSGTLALSWGGAYATPVAGTLSYTQVGNIVTLSIGGTGRNNAITAGTGTTINVAVGTLPVSIRPSASRLSPCLIWVDYITPGTPQLNTSELSVNPNGSLQFFYYPIGSVYNVDTGGLWNTGFGGTEAITVSYCIV
jgi:hypothetical protein